MSWKEPTEDDLAASLSQDEVSAYSADGTFGSDVVAAIISRTVATFRLAVRSNRSAVMSPDEAEIPASLVGPAMDYAAYDLATRFNLNATEDRRRKREAAEKLLERVARGELAVEEYGSEDGGSTVARPDISLPPPIL